MRIRGERWGVLRQAAYGDISSLDVRGQDSSNAGRTARFLLPFEPVERLVTPHSPRVVRSTEWRVLARSALASATPRVDSLRAAAHACLDVMPYQLEPALAVTRGLGCRLLVADEVGLGKTVQAGLIIAELLVRNPDGRALVICPAGLRAQWEEELLRRFNLSAVLLDAAGVARVAAALDGSANPWSTSPLVIASIDFIKRPEVMRALEGLVWDVLVLDEAHNLATRSDRAIAAAALAWRARTMVLLSATPHSGDESAFARLCSLGDAHGKFPLLLFKRTRAQAGIPVLRRTRWLPVRPTRAEVEMHVALDHYARRVWQERRVEAGARLAISVLLRRAASSATSLARSIERRVAAISGAGPVQSLIQLALPYAGGDTDDEPLASLGTPGLPDAGEERRLLERVLTLAEFARTNESKVGALQRWLARTREPVLVFTEYRDTLGHLRRALVHGGIAGDRIVELHGGLTRSEREAAEIAFTTEEADVLLATDAASEGLNLHHRCRCVINLEVPWNPNRLEQRIGRVDRIGQRQRVHATHLVAAGTLETAAMARLLERSRRAAGALGSVPPSDVEIANAILTGVELPAVHRPVVLSTSLQRPDLSSAAAIEAERIRTARRLQHRAHCTDGRPFVTSMRHTRPSRSVWAIEWRLTDVEGTPVWDVLVGLTDTGLGRCRTPREVRAFVASSTPRMLAAAGTALHTLREAAAGTLHDLIALGAARERAIIASVRMRHARIAADVLQPGLFDRRAERQAASQSLALEDALGRCHARLDALARLEHLRTEPPSLRFAALLE